MAAPEIAALKRGAGLAAGACLAFAVACSGGASRGAPAATLAAEREGDLPVVSWEEAGRYLGREVVVTGKVVAAKNTGRACFLNFHPNWKRYFTAVIFSRHFGRFPAPPEKLYLGRSVRVTGKVRDYQGKPEIIVHSPAQIRTVD